MPCNKTPPESYCNNDTFIVFWQSLSLHVNTVLDRSIPNYNSEDLNFILSWTLTENNDLTGRNKNTEKLLTNKTTVIYMLCTIVKMVI